jgi:hypothetical protein
MKLLSETYKELGIAFSFPIDIKDDNGNLTYHENSDSGWYRCERDANGKTTYCENSNGFWCKYERDANGNETYFENSDGYTRGTPRSAKTCDGKVVVVDGTKYKLQAL